MDIYEIRNVKDNPSYEGFSCSRLVDGKSLLQSLQVTYDESKRPIVPSLASQWVPLELDGQVSQFHDYPCVNGSIPAFSERAVVGLRDILDKTGEILAASHRGRNVAIFNVQCMPQVLDRDRTIGKWADPRTRTFARTIDAFQFLPDRLDSLYIFRLFEQPYTICVTEAFVDRVEDLALNGFSFCKLWPMITGEKWWEQRNTISKANEHLPPPAS